MVSRREISAATFVAALSCATLIGASAAVAAPSDPSLPPPLSISLLPFLPEFKVRTLLVAAHLLGLSAGLGSVITLDLLLMKAVFRGRFHMRNANMIWILARTTSWGLSILWLSGLGFFALYLHDQPDLLNNPKIIAKVTIVTALTLNGWLIHKVCLPHFMARLDQRPLVSMPPGLQVLMLFTGVASCVSWYAAMLLGVLKELNGKVPASTLIMMWGGAVLVGFAAVFAVFHIAVRLKGSATEIAPLATTARGNPLRPSKLKRDASGRDGTARQTGGPLRPARSATAAG